jgi:hypothetical protein
MQTEKRQSKVTKKLRKKRKKKTEERYFNKGIKKENIINK